MCRNIDNYLLSGHANTPEDRLVQFHEIRRPEIIQAFQLSGSVRIALASPTIAPPCWSERLRNQLCIEGPLAFGIASTLGSVDGLRKA